MADDASNHDSWLLADDTLQDFDGWLHGPPFDANLNCRVTQTLVEQGSARHGVQVADRFPIKKDAEDLSR
ncbi:MAG: hypothetical protein EOP85_05895 [Verrucomicrobiaceae bacterium]|nr:MAG: hypothetical protein EOP85_05895 [Verrucomicrobiaceae bacterium]